MQAAGLVKRKNGTLKQQTELLTGKVTLARQYFFRLQYI